jgi:protocatechuate 3,4-dioxygenase, alpha subunit
MIHRLTPSQTVGPYFAIGLPYAGQELVVPAGTVGEILITGTIYDGHSDVVPDHVFETWQADPAGKFADMYSHGGGASELEGFKGYGRWTTEDGDGSYQIRTVKPGRVADLAGRLQAPHIDVSLFARGMLNRVVTRIYFGDEADANAEDPVLATVPGERRQTLIAQPTELGYHFDVRLQGEGETVFFAV